MVDQDATEAQVAALLALAQAAAADAGAELARRFGRVGEVATKSSSVDYVTEADQAAEQVLVARLRAARPHDAVLGEEGGARAGGSGLRWVLDPLDGTVNYVYGRRAWCVSVACVDDRGALVGVVHDPLVPETFAAVRGGGAWRDGAPLTCPDAVALPQALIGTGFAYDRAARRAQGEVVARVVGAVGNLRRGGAAALDLCDVACGRLDGFYEDHLNAWDRAAGELVATEAGAARRAFGEDGVVVAGPSLVDALTDLLVAPDPRERP